MNRARFHVTHPTREGNLKYLDQEIPIKKKLTIESALNEEEDDIGSLGQLRSCVCETLCKSLDDADLFCDLEDIDWDDHEQKWTEFDSTTLEKRKET